jgi:hypothetical protein
MMIQNTERFKSDVKQYSEAIEKIPEGQSKTEAKSLLNNLINEVKNMDNMYMDMVYSKQLTSLGGEIRDKITSLRKQLDSKLNRN